MDSTTAQQWSASSQGDRQARSNGRLFTAVAALADPAARPAAAHELATLVGAEELIVILHDHEVGVPLPAPGFPQTLPDAAGWRAFAAACAGSGSGTATLPFPGRPAPSSVVGVAGADGSVLALVGGSPASDEVAELGLLLPIIAAALRGELTAQAAHGQSAVAREIAGQATLLAASLDEARRSLQRALAEARVASDAKDHFLAVLSHELRTPLTPVLITACLLETDPRTPPELLADVQGIRRNVELEARLIDDLLDLTRVEHGKLHLHLQPTDAHLLLAQTLEMYRGEMHQKRLSLRYEPSATHAHLRADPARLQQVFWNLIKNAVKFTPDGGTITVRTADDPNERLRIDVIDTGIGIEPDKIESVFGAFEQAHPSIGTRFGGLGLGLSISKALVDMHGGTIQAASGGPGRGSIFTVWLATTPRPAPSPGRDPAAPNGPGGARRLRILLVEDHESTARLMVRLLQSFGHDVHAANSVATARAAADAEPFDLLVSDVGLPDGTGIDLMRYVRERHKLRGIALTGYGMEEDVRDTAEAGFAEHLTKPIDPARLRAAIARLT